MDLPVEEAILFKQAFDVYDKNHDGLLSKQEFRQFFEKSGRYYTDKQINFYFRSVEPKSKGYIDFNGFLNLLFIGERCLQPETIAKNLFYEFDIDNDGHIGFDEFKDMMADLYSDHIKNIDQKIRTEFRSVDVNGSERISLKEMASILKAHLEK